MSSLTLDHCIHVIINTWSLSNTSSTLYHLPCFMKTHLILSMSLQTFYYYPFDDKHFNVSISSSALYHDRLHHKHFNTIHFIIQNTESVLAMTAYTFAFIKFLTLSTQYYHDRLHHKHFNTIHFINTLSWSLTSSSTFYHDHWLHLTWDVAQWSVSRNSNPKTLGSIP